MYVESDDGLSFYSYIAARLLEINERKTFHDPPLAHDPAAVRNQDDELFNKVRKNHRDFVTKSRAKGDFLVQARLVNCGHFMNAILTDYIGAILGLPKDGNTWRLNPLNVSVTLVISGYFG